MCMDVYIFLFPCSTCHYKLSANEKKRITPSANRRHGPTKKHPQQPLGHHPVLITF